MAFRSETCCFTPAIGECPIDPEKLDDRRRTYAVNTQQGLTVDRIDNWRDEDSSDGDHCPSRWTGYTEFWIQEDCAPATQWTGERLLLEYRCGPQSRIGNTKK
eukprot:1936158-Pyramimonas_sp.AAC.1